MAPQQPLIIKRIKRVSHGGHHGGAWKVAYADFVTAMMAFFLLLWLLNVVTDEQLHGIADYFAPITTRPTTSGAGGILSGDTIRARHNYPNRAGPPNASFDLSAPKRGDAETEPLDDSEPPGTDRAFGKADGTAAGLEAEELDRLLKEREEEQFRDAAERLREALENAPQFKLLARSLKIDNTPEGLRIQIHDQDALAMFPLGSTEMYLHTRRLLELIADVILQMPQQVAITGHTDATPYVRDNGYGNWELSADRANAARRVLLAYGVPESRVSRVVGKSATEPLVTDEPAAPANRRLSLVLLRGTAPAESAAAVVH
jgi:chemotaxis protein MotB